MGQLSLRLNLFLLKKTLGGGWSYAHFEKTCISNLYFKKYYCDIVQLKKMFYANIFSNC